MGRQDEDEYVTYTMVITPASADFPADTATIKIKKFAGGSPREWLRWSNQFRRLARKKQWTDEQKAHNMVALIDGDLATEVEVIAQDAVEHGRTFEQFFTDVGLLSVPHDYSEDLDNELWTMVKRRDETVLKFSQRLRENIRLFAELPQNAEEIPEIQQCRYFKRGMPRAWQEKLSAAGVVFDHLNELILYFTRIEKDERQLTTRDKKPNTKEYSNAQRKNQRRVHGQREGQKNRREEPKEKARIRGDNHHKRDTWCSFHKTASHNTSDCYTIKKKQSEENKKNEARSHKHRTPNPKYPRIARRDNLDAESESESDAAGEEQELKFVGLVEKDRPVTSAPLRIMVKLHRNQDAIEALIDSGASKSIVNGATLACIVKLGRQNVTTSPTIFDTMRGAVPSNGTVVTQFFFPQLKPDTIITHQFEVIKSSSDNMVIGRDVMNALGLILNFKDRLVQWDDCLLRLNTGQEKARKPKVDNEDLEFQDEMKEATTTGVHPETFLPNHLGTNMKTKCLALLVEYKRLYDGHLGRMRFPDYELPIRPDYKPVHAKSYPIARSQESKAKETIQRLISADVLEQIYDAEMASPAFFVSKPDGSLRLLNDYRGLNKYLRRSPYYVPRI